MVLKLLNPIRLTDPVEPVTDSNLLSHSIQDTRHISQLCLLLAANSLHQLITGLQLPLLTDKTFTLHNLANG